MSPDILEHKEVISVKEARKLLGLNAESLSDETVEMVVRKLHSIAISSITITD